MDGGRLTLDMIERRQDTLVALPPSYPWHRLVLIFLILTSSAFLCGLIFTRFLELRPLDLRAETAGLADTVEGLFIDSHIPRDRVRRESCGTFADRKASWSFCAFDIEVTEPFSAEGVEQMLRRNMLERNVAVSPSVVGQGTRTVDCSIGGRRFASVTFREGIPESQSDLRGVCRLLSDRVEQAVMRLNPAPANVRRIEIGEKGDADAVWSLTRIEVRLAEGAVPEEAAQRIVEDVRREEFRVVVVAGNGTASLHVFFEGCEFLVVQLLTGTETPVEPLPPAPEETVTPVPEEPPVIEEPPVVEEPLVEAPLPDSPIAVDDTLGKEPERVAPVAPETKRVAIIIDDGGYGGPIMDRILALDPRLTLSILPNTRFARETAERGHALGFEIMLHMPMEHDRSQGRLTIGMDATKVAELTEKAMASVPYAVGVNNHAGSSYTANADAMRRFLDCIKPHGLYFVDSRTTTGTKAYDVAKEMTIPSIARDVFLDHETTTAYIEQQFARLILLAQERGVAVAIGHFRPVTAGALERLLPTLEQNGIQLVHVSELVQ
ncbi:MAG: uncharacterized protein QG656_1724 [Candidatus Hydrogenedentes bacterium]|nr:uncharacterized protein [Candidatus Hydrogenedentota bacterium]